MNQRYELRRMPTCFALLGIFGVVLFWPAGPIGATVFDWDNYSGDSDFSNANNWRPTSSGAPPQTGDTAVFDGELENLGIVEGVYNNTVEVLDGTAIDVMQVFNTPAIPATVVDLTIGDGTTANRFDLDDTTGDSLVVGNSFGDTATLNLLGGRLDTFDATIGGRALFNVINPGSLWDSRNVLVSGDTTTNTAGIGLGLRAQIVTHGNLDIGSDTGSGRVVVENTGTGNTPTLWTVTDSVDIGPTGTSGFNFGHVTLQAGGQMSVDTDVDIHGADVNSTLTVQTGGDLDVSGSLNIAQNGVLELFDSTSTITAGDIDNNGGTLDWTGGTLHIVDGELRIDDSANADLDIDSLTVDSSMTLKVTSTASPNMAFRIGDTGMGTMTIQNGGVVESHHGAIGFYSGSDGTVDITGNTSSWTLTEDLGVGVSGSGVGRLNITGGQVSANTIWLGAFDTADGTVTVDNGTLTSTAVLAVGGRIGDDGVTGAAAGGTGQLTVKNGGIVDVASTLVVFGGSTVELTGSGSQITADTLRLEPGASFTDAPGTAVFANSLVGFGNDPNFAGNLLIGHSGGSGSGSHAVGSGQTLTVGQNLVVGADAPGILSITGGTVQTNLDGIVGSAAGADGSSVEVSGSGSSWSAYYMYVGGDTIEPQALAVLTIANDAQVIVTNNIVIWGPGAVLLDSGVISTDYVEVEGELLGNGAILLGGGPTAVINRGLVAPGLSAGVITINGNASTADAYVQDASGRLIVEIGGATLGLYDRLDIVSGSAALDGFLDVSLIDPLGGSNVFVPKAGDSFEVLTADNGLGGTEFVTQSADLPALSGALMWEIVYGSDFVRLDVLTPFTADFDRDGDVDNADLGIWEAAYGLGSGADADADGDSDGADFLVWQQQFGSSVLAASVAGANAEVPEPATHLLLALALLMFAAQRKLKAREMKRHVSANSY